MTDAVTVLLHKIDPELPNPGYAHDDDAGIDLLAAHDVTLEPGERALVSTGVAIGLPAGYAGFVHPRSGLAAKLGISIVNAPGTIDTGYRGEIKVNLINHDRSQPVFIRRGDRIAQLVIQPVARASFALVSALPASGRGDNGHGSTGGHQQLDSQGKHSVLSP